MPTLSRLGAAALGAALLASPVAAFQAQEGNTVVGPAEIRDFSLPGSRQPRPEPEPTIAPVTPPVAQPGSPVATPTPAPAATPPAARTPATRTPAARTPAAPAPRQATPAPQPALPAPQDLEQALPPATAPLVPAPDAAAPLPETAPVTDAPPAASAPPPEPEGGFPWLYLLIGAALAGLGVFAFRKFKNVGDQAEEEIVAAPATVPAPAPRPHAQPQLNSQPAPRPAPVAQPAPAAEPAGVSGGIGIVMRPWLELEFKPDRATATPDGAGVQYEVVIRNVGNAPARNIRLAAQMFNAGPQLDQEIAAFFARVVEDRGAAPLTILPRTEMKLQSTVTMPRDQMREIKVQGRSLFIPTVAFNLLYNWGRDKAGQTCSSHIVGREPETPSEKMAPFRLDLGPRIYRSVGQRPSALARAV
ncbi:MAG: hypothetical protein AVDCRST_MAG23-602 [uncultured Sphingosinicella sp.]|uniref:Uncharacterized protein n=1 Tax=uncultured Sphingosinicella sp. TaxID=478748 RepID=A0A6J4TLR4_9SPHN|nr:MAG: hypothetical protein AVDCRST_MAG23-602 [uncultured Sphingosinicella sp.]